MELYGYFILGYCLISNMVAVIMTVHDKRAARAGHWRVQERTLLLTAALSGCVVMYITMRLIHHKTRKVKFMAGIPVIFLLECAAGVLLWRLTIPFFG